MPELEAKYDTALYLGRIPVLIIAYSPAALTALCVLHAEHDPTPGNYAVTWIPTSKLSNILTPEPEGALA